jgi:RimJ/RimL family protein N-acetyltransferase
MDMTGPVFLRGERIYLRPMDMEDLEKYLEWYNDPALRRFLLLPYPTSRNDEKEYIEKMTKGKDEIVLSIVIKKGERLIGNIGLHRINRVNRSAMLGIAIGDLGMASKGLGTEAIRLMLDYGFGTLNLHRIELFVHDFNERAQNAYKKLGFVEEGRKREALYLDGKYHDELMLAILKDEWSNSNIIR